MPDSDWSQSGSTADSSWANSQNTPTLHVVNDAGEASPSDSGGVSVPQARVKHDNALSVSNPVSDPSEPEEFNDLVFTDACQ
ncbi:hypothetical protein WG66_009684 [Moniliophthora roreri]|nr:hypothetical protein WG66_009684 [Moniliophthora roreri]